MQQGPFWTPAGCFRTRGGKRDEQEIRLLRLLVPQSLCEAEGDKQDFGCQHLYTCCVRNTQLAVAGFANSGLLAVTDRGRWRLSRICSQAEISNHPVSRTCTHSKDEAEGRCNVCFKGRYVRLGCCKHKGCSMMSGFGLQQNSDTSREKIHKTQGNSVKEN